jgi:aspartyl-tRNA(Asn)/glutamyl-tRNA(Gln) amidotransferase subunit A
MGVLAGCVYDLALLLQTIAVPEEGAARDAWNQVPDYATALGNPLRPPRLAWLKGLFEDRAEPVVRSMMAEVVDLFRRRQAQVEEVVLPPSFAHVEHCHRIIMAAEAARFHEERLRRHPDDYGPKMTALLEEGLAYSALDYVRAREHQKELRADMDSYVKDYHALLCPATTGPAPGLQTTGNPVFNSPWSYTGLPTVSLPAGLAPDGMPLAIQLVGAWWGEKELSQVAGWCEEGLAGRFPGAPPGSDLHLYLKSEGLESN